VLPAVNCLNAYSPLARSLMETEISIEYGKKLKGRRIIHQELLCCHSEEAQWLFKNASLQRQAYSSADELRKQLKEFVYPRTSEKTFDETHSENKACNLFKVSNNEGDVSLD
jgi:hypothetical protein